MKKRNILTFSFISLLAISQVSFINSKNILIGEEDNPYVPYSTDATTYSGKSFDLVDQNNSYPFASSYNYSVGYIQIIDDVDDTILNDFINNEMPSLSVNYDTESSGTQSSVGIFSYTLSNPKNNTYYFVFMNDEGSTVLNSFNPQSNFAIGSSTDSTENSDVLFADINTEDQTATEVTNYDVPDNTYPYIDTFIDDTSVFSIDEVSPDGSLTFTIKVNNWTNDGATDYLQQEDTIGITLKNNNESEENLKYEQYQANLIDSNGSSYTYKVNGLTPDTNYTFYSINYTGLTEGNDAYDPDIDVTMSSELELPANYITFDTTFSYIDPANDMFVINNVDTTSIEFSLNIVDTGSKFTDSLAADNTMDVTVQNVDTTETTTMDATFINEDSGIFTFKIDNLVEGTNYQIISLDNTDLYVNNVVDENILLIDDLGLSQEESSFMTTSLNTGNIESKDGNMSIIIGSVVGFLLLVAITFGLYYFFKKNNKKRA